MKKDIKKYKLRQSKYWLATIGSLCLTIIILVIAFWYLNTFFSSHTLPATTINGLEFALTDRKTIAKKLAQLVTQKKQESIYFSLDNNFFEKKLSQIGALIDIDGTLNLIFNQWSEKSILEKIKTLLNSLAGKGLRYEMLIKFDEAQFNQFINELKAFESPAVDYSLIFNGYNLILIEGKDGAIIDKEILKQEIKKVIWSSDKKVSVRLKIRKPDIDQQEALRVYNQAKELIDDAPYIVKFENKTWHIDRQDIGAFIVFKKEKKGSTHSLIYDFDKEKIASFINLLAPQVNSQEQNITLGYDGENKLTVLEESKVGYVINIEENTELIYQALLNKQKEITLKITEVLPLVRVDTLKELGIEKLLGVGKTSFDGSPPSRIHNIIVGTSKFNKILIPPNTIFSFNEILGKVGAEAGYKAELVIKDNKIYPEYGGGLCQVSTTLFRAAVNSGLEIIQRSPHSIMVRYYNPAGFDAAIYPPNPDLKFKNNTSGYIYIQSKVVKNDVIFEIYGKDEGKLVKVIGPSFIEKKDDGSAKTILTQEVWQNGKQIYRKTFYSIYKPYALYPVLRNPLE